MSGEPDGSAQETPRPQAQDEGGARKSVRIDASAHSASSLGASKRSLPGGSRRSSFRRRSSNLLAAARASFVRSRGQSGASVETLRGTSGADFEGYATVRRGDGDGVPAAFDLSDLLCCGRGGNDGLYYLLIKGRHCFVFADEGGKSPKYAVDLLNRTAVVQPPHHGFVPHMPHPGAKRDAAYTTVHLETGLGDVEYAFAFVDGAEGGPEGGTASKFRGAVAAAAAAAQTEQARKRLGHEGLMDKKASVRYAENVGNQKVKEQPEAPVGAGEVLANMPGPNGMPTY